MNEKGAPYLPPPLPTLKRDFAIKLIEMSFIFMTFKQ